MSISFLESLVSRLVGWVAAIAIVNLVLLGSWKLWDQYNAERSSKRAESASAVALASAPIARALWNLDKDALSLLADRLVQAGGIVRVEIQDTDQRVVVHAGRGEQADPNAREVVVDLRSPAGERSIGRLLVSESFQPIEHYLVRQAWRSAGFELAGLLALILTLYGTVNFLVLRRLRNIDAQVRALHPHDFVTRLHDLGSGSSPHDEIGRIVQAANNLLTARAALREARLRSDAAEAANRAKSEFLSRVSHELRTPLNAVLGFAQSLTFSGVVPEGPHRDSLLHIGKAGWHLTRLIEDLLDLSRLESGNMRLELKGIRMNDLLDQVAAMLQADASSAQVTIGVHLVDEVHVRADEVRLKQVFLNLLSNAIKYNFPGGRVDVVCLEASDERVSVAVSDTGIGLNPSELSHLFEPFNRLGRESGRRAGTGIGLVITKALVEMMGGSLEVRSVSGQGTTFLLQLPSAPIDQPKERDDGAIAQDAGHRPNHVLYVEDEPVNVEVMRALLRQRPAVIFDTACTLAEATMHLRAKEPDLVLLDMYLPDGTAIDFLNVQFANGRLTPTQVIIVSADPSEETILKLAQMGATEFIPKPIDFAVTLKKIDAVLASVAQAEREDVGVG